jgi:two-component system response regulator (stage 0 sporulation protein A)
MDNIISVLIADDNIELGNVLREYLNNCEGLCVKDVARDGLETIGMLKEHAPDVVILDLIMPNLDGIGVLERVRDLKLKYKPIIIVLTAVGQDSFIQKAVQLGAEYYMVKPFDVDMLIKRIKQMYDDRYVKHEIHMGSAEAGTMNSAVYTENKLESAVTSLIRDMGIIPNIPGFHYLREAVILSIEESGKLSSAVKNIYPVIAGRHNTTASKVSRSIRNAIQNSLVKPRETDNKNIISAFSNYKRDMTNARVISSLTVKAILLVDK